jgi:hypothetical protein
MMMTYMLAQGGMHGFGYGFAPYGGWGLWAILVLFPLLLGLWAAWRVKATFSKASRVAASCGLDGAEAASEILKAHGITDVSVVETGGFLSDHYDPKAKVLRLSPDVYRGRSVASLGVAAHEAGHALQDAANYGPLKLRSAIVPMAQVGGVAANVALGIGCFVLAVAGPKIGVPLLLVGICGLICIAVFQLITLPVELDASSRAKKLLTSTGLILAGDEERWMSKTLNAAALTYVAALVSTLGTILYYLLIVMSSGNRRD